MDPGAYLEGVCEEVVVEHRPVLAPDVYNDFTEFVADKIGHRLVLREQELWQTATYLHLIL